MLVSTQPLTLEDLQFLMKISIQDLMGLPFETLEELQREALGKTDRERRLVVQKARQLLQASTPMRGRKGQEPIQVHLR